MQQDTSVEGLIITIVLLAIGYGMSIVDAVVADADENSPMWKRVLSEIVSKIAFNVGKASNDPKRQ